MSIYSVVKKGKYYKTVFTSLVSTFVEQGAEEVTEKVIFATTSTNYVNPDAPAYIATPNGIHPSVVKIENFQTLYSIPQDYKQPELPEGYVLLGVSEPFPEEETGEPAPAATTAVEPTAVEQAAAPPAPTPAPEPQPPAATSTSTAPVAPKK